MSALTSSLQVLEQQLNSLNSSSAGMASIVSTAYGTEQQNREDQAAVAVTDLLQVCYPKLCAAYHGFSHHP